MTLSADQIAHLAQCAGVHPDTVRGFVAGKQLRQTTASRIRSALRGPECAHLGWLLRRHGS